MIFLTLLNINEVHIFEHKSGFSSGRNLCPCYICTNIWWSKSFILGAHPSSWPALHIWPKIHQTKMLVTCQRFGDLCLSGSILQYRQNIIKVGSKSWVLSCSSNITLSLPPYNGSTLKRELNFCNGYLSLLYFCIWKYYVVTKWVLGWKAQHFFSLSALWRSFIDECFDWIAKWGRKKILVRVKKRYGEYLYLQFRDRVDLRKKLASRTHTLMEEGLCWGAYSLTWDGSLRKKVSS